jgi:hypothetical protein
LRGLTIIPTYSFDIFPFIFLVVFEPFTSLIAAMYAATLLLGLAVVGNASPMPQEISYAAVASPIPSPTISVGVASQVVTYNPKAAASQVSAALSSSHLPQKINKRTNGNCAVQPVGAGPVPTPDTPAAFEAYQPFAATASSAPTPSGYNLAFTNINASNNANGYMGFTTLQTYDTAGCAAQCNAITGCSAINICMPHIENRLTGSG